ncbi:MAG: hypothetical protein KAS78_01235 [Candidatus Pacebacteria bacterium]|nr:hypothetical protein [Candidatus Paceibacterota bacterium]
MTFSIKRKTLKKIVSSLTMIVTVVSMSGMMAFSTVVAAEAITDGALIKSDATNTDGTPTLKSLDVYIVKVVGEKKFKRLMLNPTVFESYEHLSWGDIQTVSQAVMDEYTTSSLVRVDTDLDEKVYAMAPDGDIGSKSWVNLTSDQFLTEAGSDADSIYTINATDGGNYTAVGDITVVTELTTFYADGKTLPEGVTPVPAGALVAALSADTPASGYVSKGVQNAVFAKFNFTTEGETTVSKVVLQRKGLGYDADISTIRLYDGITQLGTDQSLNTTTHQVTFNNLGWELTSGQTTVLTVKANIATSPGGTNDYFELVEVESDATSVSGLPIAGNAMQFSALSVGQLDVDLVSGTQTVISGETGLELGCWNFAVNATEGFHLDSLKVTNTGSSSAAESDNFSLKVSGTELAESNVAEMASDATITFDMSADPYFIDKSTTKKICVYGDITAGITVSKTLILQIAETKDVAARGDSSAGEVLITYSSNTAFASQTAKTNTISQGDATLAQNAAYAPTSGTAFVKGVPSNKMAAYKLTAGSNEGVRLTKLTIVLAGTNVANTDLSNWMIYKIVDGAEVEIPVTGSVSGLNVTFEDTTNGLIDVAKSENETVIVRSDVTTSVGGNESGVHVYVGADGTTNTVARIKGLASGDYVSSGVTLSGVATGDAQTFTVGAKGNLTVSKAATSPSVDTVAKGTTDYHFTTINLYATGEDINVTDLDLTAYEETGQTNVVDSGELSNVYITDENGTQLGSTISTPSTGVSSFSFSYTTPKETNKTLKVYGTIPSGSSPDGTMHIDMKTANTDITSTGAYSSGTIVETGTATGSDMTVSGPTLVAAMATSPIAASYVINDTEVTLGTLVLTAGTPEDVKVTSIKISAGINTDAFDAVSVANTSLTNFKLIDANDSTQYGITQNLTDGTPDYVTFSGINNLTVLKGGAKTLNVVVDVKGSSLVYEVGVKNASTEITGTGISSNTAATVTPATVVNSTAATLTTVGVLKVNKAADMPAAAQVVSGTTGVELMKYKLEASYEDVDITVLPLYYTGTVADVSNVKIYLDGAQIGATSGYVLTAGLNTVNLTSGTFVVPRDGSAVLTIKADMNPKAQVTTSTTSVYIGIADSTYTAVTGAGANSEWDSAGSYNITAKGSASGATVAATDIDSLGTGGGNAYGSNAYTIHKGTLTVTLNTSSPSGLQTAGTGKETLRFDLTAAGDDININGLEICLSGSATNVANTPIGTLYLKSSDLATTYGDITMTLTTDFDAYWSVAGLAGADDHYFVADSTVDEARCISFGDGTSMAVANAAQSAMEAFDVVPSITAGTTKSFSLIMDTTGIATNETLQATIGPNAYATCGAGNASACAVTTSGIEYEDSSGTDIDLASTKNLPLSGGGLSY